MSNSSQRHEPSRIETLEELILMSASGLDADVQTPDLIGAEIATQEAVAEGFFAEILSASDENEPDFSLLESGADVENVTTGVDAGTPPEFLPLAASDDGVNLIAAAQATDGPEAVANNAAAVVAAYSEYLVLNGDDNQAVLEDNGNSLDDLVQLRSVNGTFETVVFRLPTDVLVIDMGDGNDSLVVNGLELGSLTANVFIYGQGGDDSVALNGLTTLNDVYVNDLDGDNTFRSARMDIGGSLYINDGDGNQSVLVRGTVNGDVFIASTNGDSGVNVGSPGIESSLVRGSVVIDNHGVGSDVIRLSGRIDGNFYINASDGNFSLNSIFSSVGGSLFTNVDSGDSTIFLGDFSAAEESYFISAEGDTNTWLTMASFGDGLTIRNGLGFDDLRLDATSILNADSEFAPGLLTVNNGDGGSSTALNRNQRIFALRIGEVQLNNGLGTDTIEINLRERDTLGAFYANNGDGDTTVDITGDSTMQAATFVSGEGTDVFSLDGIDIENALIINTGSGERTVDIQNAEVGDLQISGSSTVEIVYGAGDDAIYAPVGNNIIDGGGGNDVLVVYQGTSADYDISYEADGRVIVEGPGLNGTTVRNELINVERILFNDGEIFLDDQGGEDPPTILGTDGNDYIAVSERGGNVEAGDGDDTIYAPISQTVNEIDGGAGTDTLVVYEGARADYTLRRRSESLFVELEGPGLNGSTVINHLTDVEYILFTDGLVNVADLEITPGIVLLAAT